LFLQQGFITTRKKAGGCCHLANDWSVAPQDEAADRENSRQLAGQEEQHGQFFP
jgi:hypothetical protein